MVWDVLNILLFLSLVLGSYLIFLFIFTHLSHAPKDKPSSSFFDKGYPFVSIIVPAYNEEKTIVKTLASLVKLDYPKNRLEVLVIDDGSTDKTYDLAKEFAKSYDFIKVFRKPNGGKGDALNYGIKHAKGEFIVSMDADSYVERTALKKMLPYFSDPNVMAVTASLKVNNPKTFFEKIQHVEYLWGIFLRKSFSLLDSLYITPGPFTIYRKWFFDKYGGFRDDVITEDMEIGLRIKKHGYGVKNVIDAPVYTSAPKSFKELLKQRLRWYLGGLELTFKDYRFMLFNKSYAVLGLLVLPAAYITTFLAVAIFVYMVYYVLKRIYDFIDYLYVINFDVITLIKSFNFSFTFYLNPLYVVSFILLLLSMGFILYSKRKSKDKFFKEYYLIYYYFLYWILFSIWWLVVLFYAITGKEVSFGNLIWKKGKVHKKSLSKEGSHE